MELSQVFSGRCRDAFVSVVIGVNECSSAALNWRSIRVGDSAEDGRCLQCDVRNDRFRTDDARALCARRRRRLSVDVPIAHCRLKALSTPTWWCKNVSGTYGRSPALSPPFLPPFCPLSVANSRAVRARGHHFLHWALREHSAGGPRAALRMPGPSARRFLQLSRG
uniref:Uncharacterized protein n=1 Tax=Plectus sambesii TaxID=2011161 RepID=A0A914VMG3_9BILA